MNTFASTLLGGSDHAYSGRESAVQRVCEVLRTRIISFALPPGSILSRNEIAAELGVSLTPVREALQQLETEGLVRIYPQSKTLVTRLSVKEIHEAQLLRIAVETEVVRRLAMSCPPPVLGRLNALIGMQEALADQPDELASFQELDELFHRTLMAGVGHESLHDLLKSRSGHFNRLRRLHLPNKGKISMIMNDHRAIVDAVAKGDPDAAQDAVRHHLSQTITLVDDIRDRHPEYFT